MKTIKIISLAMLVIGIVFAIVGDWGEFAAYFLIPTSLLFLALAKIIFLVSAKFTCDKKKDLTYTATGKPRDKMKSIKTVCFSMLIFSIGLAVFGTWGVIAQKFQPLAISALMISYFLFPMSLLLLLVAKIASVISAKVKSHKKDDLAVKLTAKPTAKPNPNMQTVKVISLTMFIISVGFGAFAYWGTYTQARYDRFNDIAGLIPISAFILSVLFFITALFLIPLAKFYSAISAEFKS